MQKGQKTFESDLFKRQKLFLCFFCGQAKTQRSCSKDLLVNNTWSACKVPKSECCCNCGQHLRLSGQGGKNFKKERPMATWFYLSRKTFATCFCLSRPLAPVCTRLPWGDLWKNLFKGNGQRFWTILFAYLLEVVITVIISSYHIISSYCCWFHLRPPV